MNSELKDLIISSGLQEEKRKLQIYRDKIFQNESRMSKLTFDRNVGLYVFSFDKYLDLISSENSNEEEEEKLLDVMSSLEHLEGVQEYLRLREINDLLKTRIDNYFRDVNIGLRNRLINLDLPEIFVYGKDRITHIIDNKRIKSMLANVDTIIYPLYDIKSLRDLRHFYNKLSFHYLNEMVDDCDYDISSKKLGKIRIN